MPHGERDMDDAARQIEIAFEIARHYDADIDMHIDETDDPYWHSLETLAEQTIAHGYQGRVTAGHCCAMAAWDDAMAARIIDKVKAAGLHVITNAPINLHLEGRGDAQPVRRGIARVKELLEAGVNVTCGQDDLQNMFYPYGRMDPLEVALITAHAAHLAAPGGSGRVRHAALPRGAHAASGALWRRSGAPASSRADRRDLAGGGAAPPAAAPRRDPRGRVLAETAQRVSDPSVDRIVS